MTHFPTYPEGLTLILAFQFGSKNKAFATKDLRLSITKTY